MACAWLLVLFEFWHDFNNGNSQNVFVSPWFFAWVVIAMIASFQKSIPIAGRVFMWLLAVPLGLVFIIFLVVKAPF